MIKGLAITPPVLGRISIGRVVEKNGKRLPEKDDQFTITTQVQVAGAWVPHPYDEELRKNAPNGKLRSIPVRMLFNDPDLNLRAEDSMFDRQTGRPVCVGNGETCRRVTAAGVQTLPCPSPDACELAKGGMCKPYGRLNVRIGDDDELGTVIFRTTGFNSIRTLAARLSYYKAVSGNLLACLPLELRLRGKEHHAEPSWGDLLRRPGRAGRDDAGGCHHRGKGRRSQALGSGIGPTGTRRRRAGGLRKRLLRVQRGRRAGDSGGVLPHSRAGIRTNSSRHYCRSQCRPSTAPWTAVVRIPGRE